MISIIIRTYNEEKHINKILESIQSQKINQETEIVVVDSQSTDDTVRISRNRGARIIEIKKQDFTFGRSLNIGCDAARGETLVILSGHCYPDNNLWLQELVDLTFKRGIDYGYGRQIGCENSRLSEKLIFGRYFPNIDKIPQIDFYCNNANSVLKKEIWEKFKFDEELTGLEDFDLAKRIQQVGYKIGYSSKAVVRHCHAEKWYQVKNRFEREAYALNKIQPDIRINIFDCIRYITSAITMDWKHEYKFRSDWGNYFDSIFYRSAQFLGSYSGSRKQKEISVKKKESYFYPKGQRLNE